MKRIIDKLENIIGIVLASIVVYLWLFGGLTGMIIGAVRGDWISIILSFLVPVYGAGYTVYVALSALFGGGA